MKRRNICVNNSLCDLRAEAYRETREAEPPAGFPLTWKEPGEKRDHRGCMKCINMVLQVNTVKNRAEIALKSRGKKPERPTPPFRDLGTGGGHGFRTAPVQVR